MSEPAREPLLCDLCRIFEADAMMLDGQAVCSRCANSMSPQRDFTSTRGRAVWWWREYRQAEALPLWWVALRFLQFELRMRLP